MILFKAKYIFILQHIKTHYKLTSPFLLIATLKYIHTTECAIINLILSERD